jgi:hypothetical protein
MKKAISKVAPEPQKDSSNKPIIAYVDEQSIGIRDFQRKFSNDFEVIGLLPQERLTDLVDTIFKKGAKAVVTDFNLKEYKEDIKYNVPYDGVELVEMIREIRHGFPCFVLTSYDSAAIQESKDVNLIYPKNALNDKIGNTTLQEKVRIQIKHYVADLDKNSKEFDLLLEKRRAGKFTETDEARLIELDTFLEKSLNGKKALPSIAKQGSGVKKLNELLEQTDKLISELKKEKSK